MDPIKKEAYYLEFILPGLPMTANAKRSSAYWPALKEEADKWKKLVGYMLSNKRPKKPLFRAKLTLTRASFRQPDPDGLSDSFKHVVDGLVQGRVLLDDKEENIGTPVYRWEKAPLKKGYIKVIVEEILE